MGTSSGGHLVVLAALKPTDPRYAAVPLAGGVAFDARVPYVVAMWPVICPLSRYRAKKANPAAMQGRGSPGGAIGNEDRYWLTEAAMEEGSPNFAVQRGDAVETPHILYLQNPEDPLHPRAHLDSFVAGYRKRGGSVQLEFFEGPKYDVIRSDPGSPAAREAVAKIVAFIRSEATARARGAAAVG
jgi:acetyl esterase/lipase